MSKKYYFTIPFINRFDTIWYGFIEFDKIENEIINDSDKINLLNDIITDITDVSFHIFLENNKIYLSLENDGFYYDYKKFEENIRPIIYKIEEYLSLNTNTNTNTKFIGGEFTGIEYKPDGSQYKYRIINNEIENKISLKKKVLNWDNVKK